MQGRRKLNFTLMATVAALTGVFALSAVKPAEAQRKSIRWATSSVDSYGYKVAASMTKMIEEALGGEYTVTVNPYPQTTSAGKAAMDGNAEVGYTADIGMREIYDAHRRLPELHRQPRGKLVHTWYAYPMESFMATTVARADKMKCLKDFDGQPVFYTPAGFMNWLNFQRMFKTLGYGFKHVQIDPKTQSDALQAGTIVGSVAYTVSGASLAPYWKETEIRMDTRVVNPCPDEVAKLKGAGLQVVSLDPKAAFSQERGRQRNPRRADPVRLQRPRRHAGGRRLQDAQRLLPEPRQARVGRPRFQRSVEGLHRHAGRRHQRQSGRSRACRACQAPEGAQGLERQVEGRRQRQLIANGLRIRGGHRRDSRAPVPAPPCDCSGKAEHDARRISRALTDYGDAAKRHLRVRGDPDSLAGLVFLDRLRRPAGTRRAM